MELGVELLGPPRVMVDGDPLEVDTRKAVALLARLVVEGAQRRDTLAGLLWPSSDDPHARAALRRTLSALRKGLDGHWVDADRDEVRLDVDGVETDVGRFDRYRHEVEEHDHDPQMACGTCLTALEGAVSLHRGAFMEGFHLRDCAPFEDWRVTEAQRRRRQLRTCLDRLVDVAVRCQELDTALTHARRRLQLEPLHEPTHRRLMLIHAWRGERSAAVEQYRQCVRRLEEELGVAPLERTSALHESIAAGRTPDPPGPGPAAADAAPLRPRPDTPLVGRAGELEQLVSIHEDAAEAGQVVWVEGEAGVGKTRLVHDFVARVRDEGTVAAVVSCYEEEQQVAFAAVADLLRSAAAAGGLDEVPDRWLQEAARVAPELLDDRPDLAPSASPDTPEGRRRLLEAVRQVVVGAVAGRVPGVVVVDDVHWADDASLDALAYLVRRSARSPVCIVLGVRPGVLGGDNPARAVRAETVGSSNAAQITLGRFDADRVRELAAAMDVDASPADVQRLVRESEGLPLLVVEYLELLAAEGDAADWRVPAGIRAVFSRQLERLSGAAAQLASAAAVIGRSFDVELLLETSGRDEEEAVTALEELTRAGLLVEREQGREGRDPVYGFRHRKLRDVAYEETSAARRRLLHGRTATALEHRRARPRRQGADRPPAGVLAHHLHAAGRVEDAAAAYLVAAGEAEELSAHAEAITHLRAAIELGHPDRDHLHRRVGDLLTRRGEYAAALRAYASAAAHADGTELAGIEHRIAGVHERRGDWEAAAAHVDAGLDALPDGAPGALRARLRTDRALVAHRRGNGEAARAEAREALTDAVEAADPGSRAQARNLLGMLARTAGDADEAVEHLEAGLETAAEIDDPAPRIATLNNLALARADRGEQSAGLELAKTALGLCRRHGDRHREAALCNNLADLLHRAGQREEALVYLKQAVALFAEVGEPERHEPEIWKLVDW